MGERGKERTEEYLHDLRRVGERAWSVTQRTATAAGARGVHYGRLVQRRLDLASTDRGIERLYRELGRAVFAASQQGISDLLRHRDIADLLLRLTSFEEKRAGLAGEIETLRAQGPGTGEGEREAPLADREVRAEEEPSP